MLLIKSFLEDKNKQSSTCTINQSNSSNITVEKIDLKEHTKSSFSNSEKDEKTYIKASSIPTFFTENLSQNSLSEYENTEDKDFLLNEKKLIKFDVDDNIKNNEDEQNRMINYYYSNFKLNKSFDSNYDNEYNEEIEESDSNFKQIHTTNSQNSLKDINSLNYFVINYSKEQKDSLENLGFSNFEGKIDSTMRNGNSNCNTSSTMISTEFLLNSRINLEGAKKSTSRNRKINGKQKHKTKFNIKEFLDNSDITSFEINFLDKKIKRKKKAAIKERIPPLLKKQLMLKNQERIVKEEKKKRQQTFYN